MVRDVAFGQVLNEISFAEADVDDAAADPGDEAGRISEVDKPTEDDAAAVGAVEVGKDREKGGCHDSHVGDAFLCTFGKDLGRVAGDGEGIEGARGHVEE